MTEDPKDTARRWFASTDGAATGLSIVEQYATDPPLALRTLLDAIAGDSTPPHRICELGFGPGWLIEAMRERFPESQLYGLDLSSAMTRAAQTRFPLVRLVVGDMESLPFRPQSFHVVATCWTLYFMRDIDAALDEIKATLPPGGRLVAATVGPDHMHELDEMTDEAMQVALGREREPDIGWRFNLQTGEAPMRRHFDRVELREWRGEMRLPDADVFLRYWAAFGEARSLPPEERRLIAQELRTIAQRRVGRDGAVHITRHDGAFIGVKAV